jgi:hypothetical protein
MEKLKAFIKKRKYDLLSLSCLVMMFFVHVIFALPAIIFLVIGESKSNY